MKSSRITGSLLGLALGDAFGAPYEGGIIERSLWKLIGKRNGKRRWTDDTQMAIDLAESVIEFGYVNQNDLAKRFANSYRWSRGYGPGAAKVLKRIRKGESWRMASRSVWPEGSFGNGGAMRAPVVGLFFANAPEGDIAKFARASAEVTHAHPFAGEGAALIALATAFACHDIDSQEMVNKLTQNTQSPDFLRRLGKTSKWLHEKHLVAPKTVATELGNGISATTSCVTAIYVSLALRDETFEELLAFLKKVQGDVDTIAAMACAIWGAFRGIEALPEAWLRQLEQREKLICLAESLAKRSQQ